VDWSLTLAAELLFLGHSLFPSHRASGPIPLYFRLGFEDKIADLSVYIWISSISK
jgi:hypothetical protein